MPKRHRFCKGISQMAVSGRRLWLYPPVLTHLPDLVGSGIEVVGFAVEFGGDDIVVHGVDATTAAGFLRKPECRHLVEHTGMRSTRANCGRSSKMASWRSRTAKANQALDSFGKRRSNMQGGDPRTTTRVMDHTISAVPPRTSCKRSPSSTRGRLVLNCFGCATWLHSSFLIGFSEELCHSRICVPEEQFCRFNSSLPMARKQREVCLFVNS
jgi:hypothetical protein